MKKIAIGQRPCILYAGCIFVLLLDNGMPEAGAFYFEKIIRG